MNYRTRNTNIKMCEYHLGAPKALDIAKRYVHHCEALPNSRPLADKLAISSVTLRIGRFP